jgi:hypothetical protein
LAVDDVPFPLRPDLAHRSCFRFQRAESGR